MGKKELGGRTRWVANKKVEIGGRKEAKKRELEYKNNFCCIFKQIFEVIIYQFCGMKNLKNNTRDIVLLS